MRKNVRPYDHVGRYGGEEFLLVLSNPTEDIFDYRLSSLHKSVTKLVIRFEGHQFTLTCSVGVSFLLPGQTYLDANKLISMADKALYEAKNTGRNCVVRAPQTLEGKIEKLDVDSTLEGVSS